MSVQTWDAWYNDVMPWLPGIDTAMVDWALRNAAIEFCQFSKIHTYQLPVFQTVDGTREYTLTPPSVEVQACDIVDGYSPAGRMTSISKNVLTNEAGLWETQEGVPYRWYFETNQGIASFYPLPNDAYDINLLLALKPVRNTSTGLEDAIANQYHMIIAAGAIGTLASMPKKPWSNPQLAKDKSDEFFAGKGAAKADALRAMTTMSLYVAPRAFV